MLHLALYTLIVCSFYLFSVTAFLPSSALRKEQTHPYFVAFRSLRNINSSSNQCEKLYATVPRIAREHQVSPRRPSSKAKSGEQENARAGSRGTNLDSRFNPRHRDDFNQKQHRRGKRRRGYRRTEILHPELFNAFDPNMEADNADAEVREKALACIKGMKYLSSVLDSWSKSDREDAPRRCYLVLDYLRWESRTTEESRHQLKPNAFTYKIVISAFAYRGQIEEAQRVLKQMEVDLGPGSLTTRIYNTVCNAWAFSHSAAAPEHCVRLMEEMRQKGLPLDTNSYANLIFAYSNRGRVGAAERTLRELLADPVAEVSTFAFENVMNAWAKSDADDAPDQCERLLAQMIQVSKERELADLVPSVVTYGILVDSYAKRGRAQEADAVVRNILQESKVEPNSVLFNSLINAWSKSDAADAPDQCQRVLEEMKQLASERGIKDLAPTVVTYGTVVNAFAKRGLAHEAEGILRVLLKEESSIHPNAFIFNSVVTAWARSGASDAPRHCRRLVEEMRLLATKRNNQALLPNAVTYNALIDVLGKRQRVRKAEKVLTEMIGSRVQPTVITFTSIVDAWSKYDDSDDETIDAPTECRRVLSEMKEYAVKARRPDFLSNVVPHALTVSAYARRGRPQEAEAQLREMLEDEALSPTVDIFNLVIKAWLVAAENDIDAFDTNVCRCRQLMAEMKRLAEERGSDRLLPDKASYSMVLVAYAEHGRVEEVDATVDEMLKEQSMIPETRTLNAVIAALGKSNSTWAPDGCEQLLMKMKRVACEYKTDVSLPDVITYGTVIDCCATHGKGAQAESVLKDMMKDSNVRPNVILFTSVMNAWSRSSDPAAPQECKRLMGEMKLHHDVATLNVIVQAYARRGQAQEAESFFRETARREEGLIQPNRQSFHLLLSAWEKSGDSDAPEHCMRILEEMQDHARKRGKEIAPNHVSYQIAVNTFQLQGRKSEAIEFLRKEGALSGVDLMALYETFPNLGLLREPGRSRHVDREHSTSFLSQ